ncbi:MAG: glycosyltransferase family 4 protein [Clostridiales bacterium]
MKVLMLTWEYPPRIVGGISRVVYNLAHMIGRKDIEIHVITLWELGMYEVEKDGENVYIHRVHTYDIEANDFVDWVHHMNMAFVEYSIRVINDFGKFDIIHAHDWIVSYAAKTIKHAYTIPLVATIHATEHGRNCGIYSDMQRYIHNKEWWISYESWNLIVNSEYMKKEIQEIFKVPNNKINVIPNGVNVNKYDNVHLEKGFREKFAKDSEKIVFFVGRLVNEKGVHVLIDAIPKVLHYYENVKFIIAGKGPEFDNLKNKVKWNKVEEKVMFTGYVDDHELNKMFKCADISVFPSLYEPFGIVALEGIVAGTTLVISDTGGLGDIIDHGYDGMKSYTGNSNSFADSILSILYNPDKAEKMKARALKKVNDIYNWEIITEKTINVYREVLKEFKNSNWKVQDLKERFKEVENRD